MPPLRAYNRLGDYSYGVYIYAWPIQQCVVAALPGIGPLGLMLAAGLPTLALAVASWHGVERRALGRPARTRPSGLASQGISG